MGLPDSQTTFFLRLLKEIVSLGGDLRGVARQLQRLAGVGGSRIVIAVPNLPGYDEISVGDAGCRDGGTFPRQAFEFKKKWQWENGTH